MSSKASAIQREKKEENVDDRHWDDTMPRRTRRLPKSVEKCYTHSQFEMHYVTMRDGKRIAADVLRPPADAFDESRGLPCVLLQTRYQRSVAPRWPIAKLLNGRPVDLLSQEARSWFLAAGYAVVAVDVRGTGASFGAWRAPWQPEERADSRQLLDWIVRRPWSNGQVVLWGVSYDGTAALFTTAEQHPAVKAAAPQYAFWDIYSDIGLPGGIPLHSFASTWTQHCLAFDSNDYSRLPKPEGLLLPLLAKGCQPVIEGLKLGGGSSAGTSDSSSTGSMANGSGSSSGGSKAAASSSSKSRTTAAARREGLRNLRKAVQGHDTWEAAVDLGTVRCADDMAAHAGKRVTDISVCSVADRIAGSNVPLQIAAGWLDSTAGPAIVMFCNAAKAPGSRLLIGPWGHGGNMYCQLAERAATRSAFPQPLEVVGFFDEACGYQPVGRSAKVFPPRLTYSKAQDQPAGSASTDAPPDHSAGEQGSQQSVAAGNGRISQPNGHANGHSSATHGSNGVAPASAAGRQEAEEPAVRYFVMGCRPHWKSSPTWPPQDLAAQPQILYLGDDAVFGVSAASSESGDEGGEEEDATAAARLEQIAALQVGAPARWPGKRLAATAAADRSQSDGTSGAASGVTEMPPRYFGRLEPVAPSAALRWPQQVDTSRYLKGKSRFDVITQPNAVIQYHRLRSAGHTLFTGRPLAAELQIVGWAEVELWVASSDADADVFVYLEDFDPDTDRARYVTEGHFRASHRKELAEPPAGDPRAAGHLPGAPFHSFARADLQPLQPGVPVRVRFQLLPTAYGFAAGHCVRLAIAGADAKHFTLDHESDRTMWIHTGAETS